MFQSAEKGERQAAVTAEGGGATQVQDTGSCYRAVLQSLSRLVLTHSVWKNRKRPSGSSENSPDILVFVLVKDFFLIIIFQDIDFLWYIASSDNVLKTPAWQASLTFFVGARTRHCAYQQKKRQHRSGRLLKNNKCYLKFNIYFNTLLEVFHNFKKSYSMAFFESVNSIYKHIIIIIIIIITRCGLQTKSFQPPI